MPKEIAQVYCPYCGKKALLVDSSEVYKQSYGFIWLCRPCDAYTGVHRSSPKYKPLGTLAKKGLRLLRSRVHKEFDPLWNTGTMSRSKAYALLATLMDLSINRCHIAMFSEEKCQLALSVLRIYKQK